MRRRARRRSVRGAISAPSRKVTPPQYMRLRARRGRVNARNVRACGRARGLGYEGYEGLRGVTRDYESYGGYVASATRRQGRSRRCATRATAVSTVPRLDAAMRRACGHARRADLSSRAGGCAALGLPAHVPPRPAYLLSGWVPWATGASALRRAEERAARAALQLC